VVDATPSKEEGDPSFYLMLLANRRKTAEYRIFGKEKRLRRLTLLLALLAAMMLAVSPVFAHPGGATHGDKYPNNYYPNDYYNYCEPGGDNFDATKANNDAWCDQWYTDYQKKQWNGEWYYYVHVYYKWKDSSGISHTWDDWYYSQYHQWDDPNSDQPYFKAWVTYKPTGQGYWESFYWGSAQQ
jgi:hypothetical protein